MRVIVTGGGTGGHIYPALAIAQGLIQRNQADKILYVGIKDGMEARLVPETGIEFKGISGQGLPRQLSIEMLKTGGKSLKAVWETKRILKEFRPDLVVGTGGYVSGPVVLTAALFGIPTILHEQNALPGITNKILARFVRRVLVTFPESIAHFGVKKKIIMAGLPVRQEIGRVTREQGIKHFALRPECSTLLITGGSRGARAINQSMVRVLKDLAARPYIQVIWATGQATYQETMAALKELGGERPQWRIFEYLKDMPQALAAADLCIGRAGAAFLAELMVAGKPAILVPYPYAAGNHQEHNARALVQAGAAELLSDKDLTGEVLLNKINELLENPQTLHQMAVQMKRLAQPEALSKILDVCYDTAWR